MCPDRDLISSFIDGEVPSPWRERLEEHIASCARCAAVAAGYSALGARLRRGSGAPEAESAAAEAAAVARGRDRLESLLALRPAPAFKAPAKHPWRSSVNLPLPLAAAAAIAVLLLGGAGALVAFRPARQSGPVQTVASGELTPSVAKPASMDELLRYLDANDGQVTLTIKLPTSATFGSAGKPVIMRQKAAVAGTPVGDPAP